MTQSSTMRPTAETASFRSPDRTNEHLNEPTNDRPDKPIVMARGTTELGAEQVSMVAPRPQRVRTRGTPRDEAAEANAPLCTLIFAPDQARASWIEGELARAPVTIQVARRVRTAVAALTKDPPPRPQILIVDFDAITPAELLELHAVRHDGWAGRLIGLGGVPSELRASLAIDHVLPQPLVRDSLLDCVAGTRHATATVPIPMYQAIAMFGLSGQAKK